MLKICLVGIGYIGLPTALLLARHHQVVGVDIDKRKVDLLTGGKLPFSEPGLNELFDQVKNNFSATTAPVPADVYILCVPTPVTPEHRCNDQYVRAAAQSIVPVLSKGSLVILESTVTPGTTEQVVAPILEKSGLKAGVDFDTGYVSEKAIPGDTINEMIINDRIVAGINQVSAHRIKNLYASFVKGTIHETTCRIAETVKLVENSYRDLNIAFANELALLCARQNMNVWEVIELANKHPRVNVHAPGPGVGGHCIPLDPWFLVQGDLENTRLIQTACSINDSMPAYVVEQVKKISARYATKQIGILGVAYKKNVDDARETPAERIITALREAGFTLRIHDPFVKEFGHPLAALDAVLNNSEGIIVLTDHDVFANLQFTSPCQWVYDTRGLFSAASVACHYFLLGRDAI